MHNSIRAFHRSHAVTRGMNHVGDVFIGIRQGVAHHPPIVATGFRLLTSLQKSLSNFARYCCFVRLSEAFVLEYIEQQ